VKRGAILELVIGALLIGLTWAATMVRVPVPPFAYFNLSECVVYTAALVFGWRLGLVAGAIGATLADFIGYSVWWPITLVVKGVEGLLVGLLSTGRGGRRDIVAICCGAAWMIAGYALGAYWLGGPGWVVSEVPVDVVQCVAGGVVAMVLAPALRRAVPLARDFRHGTGADDRAGRGTWR